MRPDLYGIGRQFREVIPVSCSTATEEFVKYALVGRPVELKMIIKDYIPMFVTILGLPRYSANLIPYVLSFVNVKRS